MSSGANISVTVPVGLAIGEARDYVMGNLYWIVPLAVALVVLGLTLWVILTWLSSRGRFMLLYSIHYLAQYGPEFDVLASGTPAPTSGTPTPGLV